MKEGIRQVRTEPLWYRQMKSNEGFRLFLKGERFLFTTDQIISFEKMDDWKFRVISTPCWFSLQCLHINVFQDSTMEISK
jgi:hypothetical protein